MPTDINSTLVDVRSYNDSALQKMIAVEATRNLPLSEKQNLAQQLGLQQASPTPLPPHGVNTAIWFVIVTGFLVVLVGSFFAMALIFVTTGKLDTNSLLLTVFTTAAGFLAGLISPSPVAPRG